MKEGEEKPGGRLTIFLVHIAAKFSPPLFIYTDLFIHLSLYLSYFFLSHSAFSPSLPLSLPSYKYADV